MVGLPAGMHCYAVSTVGFELEQVRSYIREQDAADGSGGQSEEAMTVGGTVRVDAIAQIPDAFSPNWGY
jgi:hypothetical protein